MASPLIWKVFDKSGQHVSSCRDAIGAVYVVNSLAWGAKIKANGRVVWDTTKDEPASLEASSASERRLKEAAQTMVAREQQGRRDAYDKVHGAGAAARVLEERARG